MSIAWENAPAPSTQTRLRFRKPPHVEVWGVPFAAITMDQTLDSIGDLIADRHPNYLITANLNYAMLAERDPRLAPVTQQAALVLPDGQPIVWRSRLSPAPLPERVAGSELIYRLGERSAADGWRLYLLGGAHGVAHACAEQLIRQYPGCQIAGVESPPFRQLTLAEEAAQVERICAARPDILLVAFGQPKGEIWIHERYQQLEVPVSIQVGASFDFVAGTAQRAPRMWQKCGCEWAYRMAHDPSRLVPRYAANALFLAKSVGREVIEAFRTPS